MERLWAPWRMEFIEGERSPGCVFCIPVGEPEELSRRQVLYVGRRAFVVLNRYPYTCGHLMVIPLRHTSEFASLSPAENEELARLLQLSQEALTEAFHPEGFNLGMNLGHCAGAGIREHLHHHLIPRWIGDSNFFPLVGGTRSMPERLEDTFRRLRPIFQRRIERGDLPPEPDRPRSTERSPERGSPRLESAGDETGEAGDEAGGGP